MKRDGAIGFFIFSVVGLYFVNKGFEFLAIPEALISVEKWIYLFAGVLLIIGGTYYKVIHRKGKKKD